MCQCVVAHGCCVCCSSSENMLMKGDVFQYQSDLWNREEGRIGMFSENITSQDLIGKHEQIRSNCLSSLMLLAPLAGSYLMKHFHTLRW